MKNLVNQILIIATISLLLTACGGSSSDNTESENRPPTISAGEQQSVISGDQVNLQAQANDSDGSITAILWIQTSGTAVELTSNDTLATSFSAPNVSSSENLIFNITVTDNQSAIATDSVTISVEPSESTCLLDSSRIGNCTLE